MRACATLSLHPSRVWSPGARPSTRCGRPRIARALPGRRGHTLPRRKQDPDHPEVSRGHLAVAILTVPS